MKTSVYVAIGCGIIIISIILALLAINFSDVSSENIIIDNEISVESQNNTGKTINIFVEDGIGSSDHP